jgi:hypothetical protein
MARHLDEMKRETFTIEPTGTSDHGPCECCGNRSRTVWGTVHSGQSARAVYYVYWTLTRVRDHGANFDFVLGKWGHGATPADRQIVSVAFRVIDGAPSFMVIDAEDRPVAKSDALATCALRRDQVIGTSLAAEVFAMLDAIWIADARIAELTDLV